MWSRRSPARPCQRSAQGSGPRRCTPNRRDSPRSPWPPSVPGPFRRTPERSSPAWGEGPLSRSGQAWGWGWGWKQAEPGGWRGPRPPPLFRPRPARPGPGRSYCPGSLWRRHLRRPMQPRLPPRLPSPWLRRPRPLSPPLPRRRSRQFRRWPGPPAPWSRPWRGRGSRPPWTAAGSRQGRAAGRRRRAWCPSSPASPRPP